MTLNNLESLQALAHDEAAQVVTEPAVTLNNLESLQPLLPGARRPQTEEPAVTSESMESLQANAYQVEPAQGGNPR